MAADLTAPDRHERAAIAVRAAPGEDVAVGALHDGEHMSGALVGHDDGCLDRYSCRGSCQSAVLTLFEEK